MASRFALRLTQLRSTATFRLSYVAQARRPAALAHRYLTTRSEQADSTNSFAPGSVSANTEQAQGPSELHIFRNFPMKAVGSRL